MTAKLHQAVFYLQHLLSAKRGGHGVHSPFVYRLCEEVFYNEAEFYDFEQLEELRSKLTADHSILSIEDHGAGSQVNAGRRRRVSDIALRTISSRKKSELLYKLNNFLKTRNCLELGTSLGLNAMYLARVSEKVTTVEGSADIHHFAKNLFKSGSQENISSIHGRFDDVLPEILKTAPVPDFIYLDGNHTYEATTRYCDMFLKHISERTVIVLDDIYWSPGMTKAWKEIMSRPEITLSIDCFYFGILFFRKEFREKVNMKLLV